MERRKLRNSLKEMLKYVNAINKKLTNWQDRRQEARNFYVDKLSHKEVKDENITKLQLCSLFTNPHTYQNIELNVKMFPIHWFHHQGIRKNLWNRWYIVFDHPSCNKCEVPQYFLRKLYYEFILKKIPNYFDMRDFQVRGGELAQDRPSAQQDPR